MLKFMIKLSQSERGATAVEYALIASLIAAAIVAAVTAFGGSLASFFQGLPTRLGF